MSTENYRVIFEPFTQRHYIKDYERKYKSQWLQTRKAIVAQLSHVDLLVGSGRASPPIHRSNDNTQWIIKHQFAVAGRKESPKASGNRLIAYVDHNNRTVKILYIYQKNNIPSKNETTHWHGIINEFYPEIAEIFRSGATKGVLEVATQPPVMSSVGKFKDQITGGEDATPTGGGEATATSGEDATATGGGDGITTSSVDATAFVRAMRDEDNDLPR